VLQNGEVTACNAHHFRVSFRQEDALEKRELGFKELLCFT
jgi:hypothetical protein